MSSKTNDTYRELTKAELDTVTGGSSAVSNAIDGIGKAITAAASEGSGGTPLVWVGCAWVPQWW
jgi:hypothetical protein